jgi:hypothetical protein
VTKQKRRGDEERKPVSEDSEVDPEALLFMPKLFVHAEALGSCRSNSCLSTNNQAEFG